MKYPFPEVVERGRVPRSRDADWGSDPGEENGAFFLRHRNTEFLVIATRTVGWDHVSVSTRTRCPTWDEMCAVKRLFFGPDEVVMQLHPAESAWRNLHPYCLHLWRPHYEEIPLPPPQLVAPDLNG